MLHVTVQPTACHKYTLSGLTENPILSNKGNRCRHAAGAEQTIMQQHTCSERSIIPSTVCQLAGSGCVCCWQRTCHSSESNQECRRCLATAFLLEGSNFWPLMPNKSTCTPSCASRCCTDPCWLQIELQQLNTEHHWQGDCPGVVQPKFMECSAPHLQRLQMRNKQLLPRMTPSPWRHGKIPTAPQALQAWRLQHSLIITTHAANKLHSLQKEVQHETELSPASRLYRARQGKRLCPAVDSLGIRGKRHPCC
jgi:hypothetical protein